MSKENNLTDFLTDIANTLRAQTNTTTTINPQNFSTMISNDLVGKAWVEGKYLPLTGGTLTGFLACDKGLGVYNNSLTLQQVPLQIWGGLGGYGCFEFNKDGEISFRNDSSEETIWKLTGISDSTGTSSTIAASQKCLTDNYLPLTGGTLTGTLTATKFTGNGSGLTSIPAGQLTGTISSDRLPDLSSKYLPLTGGTLTGTLKATKFTGDGSGLTSIPAGQLTGTVDAARLPDLSGKYLPISGGTITGDTTIKGSSGQYAVKFINGDIQFLGDGGSAVISTISGISSSKGTSSDIAVSQKCLSDNYVPFKNCPVLKQNLEIPVSKYSFILENNGDNLVASEKSISINDNMNLHTLRIDSNKITYTDTDSTKNWTFAGTVFSTTDLVAGTSALPSNQLYFVYE